MKMSNEPIGKDCNGVDLFVGDIVFYNNSVYVLIGVKNSPGSLTFDHQQFLVSEHNYITGKQILSPKFKTIKKAKEVYCWTYNIRKVSKQDVIDSFKKIYLDWDETMKNIDTAFERNV